MSETEYHIHSDFIFKLVFLTQTCPEDWLKGYRLTHPEFSQHLETIESKNVKKFPELFEEHYELWEREMSESTDQFISYVQRDINRALTELTHSNDFDKKSISLAGKYTKLFAQDNFNIETCTIHCNEVKIIITEKSIFHVVWGHYLNLPNLGIRERNKSIFTDHNSLEFIEEVRFILGQIHSVFIISSDRPEYLVKYNSKFYTLVLRKIGDNQYELVTFYIITHKNKLREIEHKTETILGEISLFQ